MPSGSTGPGLPADPAPSWWDWLWEPRPWAPSPNVTTPRGLTQGQSTQNFHDLLRSRTPGQIFGGHAPTPGDVRSMQTNPGLDAYFGSPHYTKEPVYSEKDVPWRPPGQGSPAWQYPMQMVAPPNPNAGYGAGTVYGTDRTMGLVFDPAWQAWQKNI
jgi:hypothetical protein